MNRFAAGIFRALSLAILIAIAPAIALGQTYQDRSGTIVPGVVPIPFSYKNITTDATTVVKAGPGILGAICVNTAAATGTITVYDNITNAGTVVATITMVAASYGCLQLNLWMANGITVVTGTTPGDITIVYR